MDANKDEIAVGALRSPAPAWAVVALACAGYFLVVVDVAVVNVAVVNVALPSIRTDLGFRAAGLQWVVSGYALTFAGFLLLGGRVADLYGRKRVFLVGLGIFCLASLAGGLAAWPSVLVAARFVQGIGAAVLSPASLAILTTSFPDGPLRARAIGTWGAVGAAGGAFGTLVGGVLTEYLSWRSVLLVNVPVGGLFVVASMVFLEEGKERSGRRLDVAGAISGTLGLAAFVFGLTQSAVHGWASVVAILPLITGIFLLAVFLAVQARFAAHPLMPLGLFRSKAISGANAILTLVGAAYFALFYFVSLYLQNVLGHGPLEVGLALAPHSLAIVLGARSAPRLASWIGARRTVLLGTLLSAIGFVWQARITPDSMLLTGLILPGVLIALGGGLVSAPLIAVATSGADRSDAGIVSGIANTARMVGGSLGLATLATVADGRTRALMADRAKDAASAAEALTAGYSLAFLVSAALLAVAAVAVKALPEPTEKEAKPKDVDTKGDER